VGQLTANRVNALIRGETGTGRGIVARMIHCNSALGPGGRQTPDAVTKSRLVLIWSKSNNGRAMSGRDAGVEPLLVAVVF
jgi:transcriptional regulator of acetoin/glycerol metabolism